MIQGGRVGWRNWRGKSFPSYLGVKKNVLPTVVRSADTMNFIDFRANSIIYLFSSDSLKVRKSKQNDLLFSAYDIISSSHTTY
jgi:hypothetical protein